MEDMEATVRSRSLGAELLHLMEKADLNQAMLAKRLGWSASKASRVMAGKRAASTVDVSAVLAVCSVKGPQRERLLALAERAKEEGWWLEFGDRLPAEVGLLRWFERESVAVSGVGMGVVPALLRTEQYEGARAASRWTLTPSEVLAREEALVRRQEILDGGDTRRFRFYIGERAVRGTGVDEDVMCDQLHELVRLGVRGEIDIRVVPEAACVGIDDEAFELIEFAEERPVVYTEQLTSVLFLEKEKPVQAYRRLLEVLGGRAWGREESRRVLVAAASARSAPLESVVAE